MSTRRLLTNGMTLICLGTRKTMRHDFLTSSLVAWVLLMSPTAAQLEPLYARLPSVDVTGEAMHSAALLAVGA
ncbi:hypothetical protein L915_09131 [Phytophthora nicotianae]|nr:hypothetical protein L915_09131 [Phytophthora nicotianae]ETL39643.1 hypothetical protein L916_09043 [Phytophthora nicotianae]